MSGMTWPKNWNISSNISGSTAPIFAFFTPYESALRADDGSVAYFPTCQRTLPWQPTKNANIWVVWGVRGHPRSSETLPFHRVHMTLFVFNRNYTSILCHFRVIARFSSKLTNFNPPHLHLSPLLGMIPFQFRRDFWQQQTRFPGYRAALFA